MAIFEKWHGQQGSNLRPAVLETAALPTELCPYHARMSAQQALPKSFRTLCKEWFASKRALTPAPEIGIADDQPIAVDLKLPPEVAGARFIEISPALFEACVALRVAHHSQRREIDEGGGDLGALPGGQVQSPDRQRVGERRDGEIRGENAASGIGKPFLVQRPSPSETRASVWPVPIMSTVTLLARQPTSQTMR